MGGDDFYKGAEMRKCTLILSVLLATAVTTTADAAKKKKHHVAAPAVVNVDATDTQRAKFFQDAINPAAAK